MTQIPLMPELGDPLARRDFHYYPTPPWMTLALLRRVHIFDALEPCSGEDAIAHVLRLDGRMTVRTNDLDPSRSADSHFDATQPEVWERWFENATVMERPFWVVTNPPFDLADHIVPLAVARARVAMMLRLSWLEPTAARRRFLAAHPPTRLIVVRRHDWRGTGSTDSVTSAWFVWDEGSGRKGMEIVTKDERDELQVLGRLPR